MNAFDDFLRDIKAWWRDVAPPSDWRKNWDARVPFPPPGMAQAFDDYGTVEAPATFADALDHPGEVKAGDMMVMDADTGAFLFAYTP